VKQAHGRYSTFQPGFGCTIAEAVIASSAAFPFFERAKVVTSNQGEPELIDGGFVANNPTLLAIADAVKAYKIEKENIKVLSLGTGIFKEPQPKIFYRILFSFRLILFPDIPCVRINEAYPQKDFETDLLESDPDKLKKLNVLGRESFAKHESALKNLFGWSS
jgi:hypothetical protein